MREKAVRVGPGQEVADGCKGGVRYRGELPVPSTRPSLLLGLFPGLVLMPETPVPRGRAKLHPQLNLAGAEGRSSVSVL